ncbi:MAG: mycothiol synthase [Propionicimonas sp.]
MWLDNLTSSQALAVDALARRCAAADGVEPVNEEARFARSAGSARHRLVERDNEVVAYLIHSDNHGTAQLAVDPAHRRRGLGSALFADLRDAGTPKLWAFGDLSPARGFASRHHLFPERSLLILERRLDDLPANSTSADGFTLRGFREEDTAALLEVNAAAFSHHPEQGSLDAHGLAARQAETWFDADGLILAVDGDGIAGFHWTKRHDATLGEVYVIGVHPRVQGRGLGRVLLNAGLAYLRDAGLQRALLYVDSAETVAVEMYASAGFHITHRDVLYAPTIKELK